MDYTAGGIVFQLYELPRKKKPATLICYMVGSERKRDTFKGDVEAAKKHCKNTIARTVTSGDAALHLSPLDNRIWLTAKETAGRIGRPVDAIVRDHLEILQILGPGVSPLEVARDWKRRHRHGLVAASLKDVVEELLTSLEGKKRDKSTIKSLRIPLRRLASHVQMPIADVQTIDLERFLQLYPANAPRTTNNWIDAIVRLFNYAQGRYLPRDLSTVADGLEHVTDDRRACPVEIFQPWELSVLLHHAPQHLKFLMALAAFAGLRTIELHRLDWTHVHLPALPDPDKKPEEKSDKKPVTYPHGFIEVPGHLGKQHRTAARRIVPIQPNLRQWLEPGRLLTGKISHYAEDKAISAAITTLLQRINVARKKHRLPLVTRPDNGFRHSYGSYRLPVISNTGLLALEMNNSEQEIISSYRELVHPDRVSEYWEIAPHEEAPIEQGEFNQAAGF